MFFTDAGGSAFEEVNELLRGADYSWPRAEGSSTVPTFQQPLYAYPPGIGRSICDGTFYAREEVKLLNALNALNREQQPQGERNLTIQRSNHLTFPPKWRGKFFFVDFMNHWLKAIDPDAPTNAMTFAKGFNGPITVEAAPDGSLLVLNRGTIWRDPKKFQPQSGSLVRIRYVGESESARTSKASVTTKESQNIFGLPDRASMLPRHWSAIAPPEKLRSFLESGQLLAYEVNVPEWHPGIKVEPALALPRGGKIGFSQEGDWEFPVGTIFLRSYWLTITNPTASPARLIERRIIVVGRPYSYGASYRVSLDNGDAELMEDGALTSLESSGNKAYHWFYPAVDDRLTIPSFNSAYIVDANTRQLNRVSADGQNQIAKWNKVGLFASPPSGADFSELPALRNVHDQGAPPELSVRSYLDMNCSICHRPGGNSRGLFDARFATPLDQAGIINGQLAAGDLGITAARIVVPGSPEKSILYRRLKEAGFFRMPSVQFHNELSPLPAASPGGMDTLDEIGAIQ